MDRPVRVLHVAPDANPDRPDPAWYADEDLRVEAVDPGGVTDDADCVVVPEEGSAAPTEVLRAVGRTPVVVLPAPERRGDRDLLVFGPGAPPDSVSAAGDVASTLVAVARNRGAPGETSGAGGPEGATATRDSTTGGRQPRAAADGDGPDHSGKIRALHSVAVDLVPCETEQAVFERAIAAAEDLLEYDDSAIYVRDGDKLVPAAVSDSSSFTVETADVFDFDQGMIGYTYRTGDSRVVSDVHADGIADPTYERLRSGLTVPLGDVGVYTAVSDTEGAFDDEGLALAEILAAHVRSAVERIRTEAEIRRERNRFAALFENVPDAAVFGERDDDGSLRIRRVNSAFETAFGVDTEAVAGDRVTDHVTVPPGEKRGSFVDGESVTVAEFSQETHDGVREFLFRGFPIDAAEGGQFYAIYTDITDRKNRKRELERKTERLEEFASIVSHDLRNPLSVASAWLELLAEGATEAQAEPVEKLRDALDRMDTLIDDLLVVSREGWTVDDPQRLDADGLVEDAWAAVATENATLQCELTGTVEGDRQLLSELFENLFRNAVEHGGSDVTVRVGPTEGDRGVSVADDGPGIGPDVRDSMFEMGASDNGGDTGLGLAIVQRVVAAHGWSVRATESGEGGARFEILFDDE